MALTIYVRKGCSGLEAPPSWGLGREVIDAFRKNKKIKLPNLKKTSLLITEQSNMKDCSNSSQNNLNKTNCVFTNLYNLTHDEIGLL